MPKTMLPKTIVRTLNREIDKASNALNNVMALSEALMEVLDTEDAKARQLAALDALESVRDDAEEADVVVSNLFDVTEKLRRFTRMAR
jgi:hypothetical protein